MQLEFYGATGTVTGSLHRVIAGDLSILLDCGLYQGKRTESLERNRNLPDFAVAADCAILSHAHIDHCGNLPNLVKQGFAGNVYMTPATRDIAALMLQDSAHIQEQDVLFLARRAQKKGRTESYEPLYTVKDAIRSLDSFVSVAYGRTFALNKRVAFKFYDAGHILGSAMTLLTEKTGHETRGLLFTGDLGRSNMPILRDPELPDGADYLIIESTYGDRMHEPRESMDEMLAEEIERVVRTRGKLYIPSFSLERAQEILLSIHKLERSDRIPVLPVYLDSPLAIAVTDVFRLHPECFDGELSQLIENRNLPFFTERLVKVHDAQESRRIMQLDEAAIIIAGSGMCESGRIRHHLAYGLGDVRNTVALVGFQAPFTLGRKLKEGQNPVRILGEEIPVHARVVSLEGFSAHADRNDLMAFIESLTNKRELRKIFLVHGERSAQESLRDALKERGLREVYIPEQGDVFDLD